MNTEVKYIDISMSETEDLPNGITTKHVKHSISQDEIYQMARNEKYSYSYSDEDLEAIKIINTKTVIETKPVIEIRKPVRKTDGCYINGKFSSKLYNEKYKEQLKQKRQAKTEICEGCGIKINSYYKNKHLKSQGHIRTVEFYNAKALKV